VRVTHDLAFLDIAVLLEHLGHLGFRETRMNTRDEEIGARVDGAVVVVIPRARRGLRATEGEWLAF